METYTILRSDGCTAKGTRLNGKTHGVVTITYPSGSVKRIGEYSHNIPIGLHQEWDEDGNLISEFTYDANGRLEGEDGND